MSELNLAASLANPHVRTVISNYVKDIQWDSVMAQRLIGYFLHPNMNGSIEPGNMRSFLAAFCTDDEIDRLLAMISDYVRLTEKEALTTIQYFNDFYKRKYVKAIIESTADADVIIKQIRNIPIIDSAPVRIDNLGDLDVDRILSEEVDIQDVLPSQFRIIRDSSPWGGYLRGQVVMVCAPPNAGKSMFLANEVVGMLREGFRGLFVALGDMTRLDFITRFSAIATGQPLYQVGIQPKAYYTHQVRDILKNLDFIVVPPGQLDIITIKDLIAHKLPKEQKLDFICIDYDANLKQNREALYQEGENIYNVLAALSRPDDTPYRVVFVASQPKIMYWEFEELPLESSSDSSRKQAIVDMVINMGVAKHARPHHAGILSNTKNRRGKPGGRTPYLITDSGRIEEIDYATYALLKSSSH